MNNTKEKTAMYDVVFRFKNESQENDIVAEIMTVINRKTKFFCLFTDEARGDIYACMTLPEILKINRRFRYSIKAKEQNND